MRLQCIYMYMDDLVLLHSWILYIDVNTSFHNYAVPDHGICLAGSIILYFNIAKEVPILLAPKTCMLILHTCMRLYVIAMG